MMIRFTCVYFVAGILLIKGLNITLQGSSQYVVPGQPFTFTCSFYSNKTVIVANLHKDNTTPQVVQYYSDKCYNITINPQLCDPLFCSCSKQGDIFTITWTLSSINDPISTWKCADELNDSPPLILRTTVPLTLVSLEGVSGSDINVVAGEISSFSCVTGETRPRAYIQWYIGNDNFTTNSTSIVTDGQDELTSVRSVLSFTPTRNQDNLVVNCKGYNINPDTTVELVDKPILNIQYPPPNPTASIKDVANVLSISEGTSITLQCEVIGGNPLAVINWSCFGGTVTNTTVSGISRSNITFRATTALNGKTCICSASHPTGMIKNDSVRINVTYGPKTVPLQPSIMYYTVNETDNLGQIQCSADCNPICSYTWTGPGSSTHTGSILQINSIKKEQAGNYFCTARNYLGKNISGNVTVIVNYGPDSVSLQPPKLMYVVYENQSIGPIQCSADCYPDCRFTWIGPGSSTITGPVLQINSLKKKQAGDYFCTASNNLGTKTSGNVTVTVYYKPKTVTLNPPNLNYTRNEYNQLGPINCTADCNPECNYVWIGPTASVNEGTLKMLNIRRDQEGHYKCIASNKFGNLSSSEVVVTVNYGPDYPVILNPSFTDFVVNETYQFGPIKCSATCKPPCTYKWIIPGQNEVQGNNLTIFNVRRSQTGLYQCIANNSVSSRASRNVDVTVHYAANVTSFKISGNNFTIEEHSTPTITCEAEGLPVPQITLRHVKNKTIIFQTTDGHLKYKFSSARCEDTGEYKCEAVNKFNQQSPITKNVYVLCYPRPVNIADEDRHIAYGYGETLNISTMYLAYPKPNFKWYFQNSKMSNKSQLTNGSEDVEIYNTFEYQSEVYRHVSNIIRKSLQEDYFGMYLVYSNNEVTSTYNVSTFSVAAQGSPNTPTNLEVECLDHHSANITWISQFNNGDTQIFTVHYNIGDKRFISKPIKDPGLKRRATTEIEGLSELTLYIFTVEANNTFGNTTSFPVNCTTSEKPESSKVFGLAIGLGFGSAFIIILVVIIVTYFIRRMRRTPPKDSDTEMNGKSSLTSMQYDGNDEDDMRVNELYVTAGPNFVKPGKPGGSTGGSKSHSEQKPDGQTSKNPSDIDAAVRKPNNQEKTELDPSAIYAVVDRQKTNNKGGAKPKKPKDKAVKSPKDGQSMKTNKSGDGQVYENVDISKTNKQDGHKKTKSPKTSVNRNEDGLLYVELDLQDPEKNGSRFVIRGIENKTDYADVDFTKRADPLPPDTTDVEKNS